MSHFHTQYCPYVEQRTVSYSKYSLSQIKLNNYSYVNPQSADAPVFKNHQGANVQFNDLGPGGKVPM